MLKNKLNWRRPLFFALLPINFADAALGAELEVPTLDGRVKLKVPEGTQSGKQFRIQIGRAHV